MTGYQLWQEVNAKRPRKRWVKLQMIYQLLNLGMTEEEILKKYERR